jgi:predicted transposase/invertase (TIGR01784 family)
MKRKDDDEIFADPTTDITFKMLFGSELHKDILISLINSLLDFTGSKEIVEVEINSNELGVDGFSEEKGQSGVTSSVDILCTNKAKQKIAIEMQGQRAKYFLSREQNYMAKLISGQVKEGEGKLYHVKILQTYIIIIGKANIFSGETALADQTLFELDVKPMVVQTNQVVPDNKMNWKFFELPKFQTSENYKTISKTSPLKEQWLEFLIDCSKQKTEPDRNEIIKQGYDIMKVAKLREDTITLYWKQKENEERSLEALEAEKKEAFDKGKIKGEIKGEISKIKDFFGFSLSKEQIISKLKFLTQDKVREQLDSNLEYIKNHLGDSENEIFDALGLIGAFMEQYDNFDMSDL